MATHGFQNGKNAGVSLPDAVPFDLPQLTRLSWELGSRVVEDNATLQSEWERAGGSWLLSVFRVTNNTVVVRIQTPVGRQRFYNIPALDLDSILPRLESAPHWQQRA